MTDKTPIETIDLVLERGAEDPNAVATGALYAAAIQHWAPGSQYTDTVESLRSNSRLGFCEDDMPTMRAILEHVRWEFETGIRSDPNSVSSWDDD